MNKFAILSIVGLLAATWFLATSPSSDSVIETEFMNFITQYGKNYATSEEHAFRLSVFKKNMEEAKVLAAKNPRATFGVTEFSDWTKEEFQVLLGEKATSVSDYIEQYTDKSQDFGTSADFRENFKPIQNQGSCGSCWTFAATATFEAYKSIDKHEVPKMSEQELVDCVESCSGCGGGLANLAYDWLVANSFCTEASYKYEARDGTCKKSSCAAVSKDRGSGLVISGEEGILSKLQTSGPVSISVDASTWSAYHGGILDSGCGMATNHAVVVTAYSPEEGGYWVIRNSWGPQYGEGGFIRLAYGKNMCNIEKRPSYPIF